MVNPKAYDAALDKVDDLVGEMRALGMYRTAELLHGALNEGRAERFEAQPRNAVTLEFTVGPIREQR
ncbi:MAG TPA: hypothetical protein VKA83_09225 [Methylomirabilota bacterium]|nr:hypothetical protein [Methylomirabilota bacterium]